MNISTACGLGSSSRHVETQIITTLRAVVFSAVSATGEDMRLSDTRLPLHSAAFCRHEQVCCWCVKQLILSALPMRQHLEPVLVRPTGSGWQPDRGCCHCAAASLLLQLQRQQLLAAVHTSSSPPSSASPICCKLHPTLCPAMVSHQAAHNHNSHQGCTHAESHVGKVGHLDALCKQSDRQLCFSIALLSSITCKWRHADSL